MSSISAGTSSGTALVSTGDTSGALQLQVNGTTPSVTLAANGSIGVGSSPSYGTNGQVLTSSGTGSAPTWATVSAGYTIGTPIATTSGTAFTFTGIPAGTKQIVMTFSGVSSSGGNKKLIQLGDAGGIETSGYDASNCHSVINGTVANEGASTQGFGIASTLDAQELSGAVILTLENATSYTWTVEGILADPPNSLFLMAGKKSLSQELTQIRLTSQSGAQTFDLGEVNIAYI